MVCRVDSKLSIRTADHDWVGSRTDQACDAASLYYSAIDECVATTTASKSSFLAGFQTEKTCTAATVQSKTDLEGLRYCTVVAGDLPLTVNDGDADFTALRDIKQITGVVL